MLTPTCGIYNAMERPGKENAEAVWPGDGAVNRREFADRGQDDRGQFGFIAAPEDCDRLSNLRSFSCDMTRVRSFKLKSRPSDSPESTTPCRRRLWTACAVRSEAARPAPISTTHIASATSRHWSAMAWRRRPRPVYERS